MGKYIAKRILSGVITIVILITACFFLMHAIPGSPFAKGEQGVPEAVMQRLNEKYGLDQPLYKQYFTYLDQILHGDFGISYKNSSVQVNELIERGFPISARIGILAVLLSLHELELAQRVSDIVVCVAGDRIDRVGTPEEIFTRAYIAKLYQMEHGKYDPCFDSLEFVP